jgi:fructose-specific component phosphotransferase system IIB-like protein
MRGKRPYVKDMTKTSRYPDEGLSEANGHAAND